MAVIEQGRIVETGPVDKLFLHPESDTARRFVGILESYRRRGYILEGAGAGI